MENFRLITIKCYTAEIDAQFDKSRLASSGIKSVLQNTHISRASWSTSHLGKGIELQVVRSDVKDALKIINSSEDPISLNKITCPKCSSSDIYI